MDDAVVPVLLVLLSLVGVLLAVHSVKHEIEPVAEDLCGLKLAYMDGQSRAMENEAFRVHRARASGNLTAEEAERWLRDLNRLAEAANDERADLAHWEDCRGEAV